MQFSDTLCYVFLTITLTATCVKAETRRIELGERNLDRRMNRREAAVIVDNFPFETIFQKPKIIYRRISKQRYGPPKPRYGPSRTKYGPSKPSLKPGKKYRNTSPKHRPPSYKKRSQKPRFNPSKRPNSKPAYRQQKKPHQYTYFPPDPAGFGEPPTNFDNEYQPPKTYGEPSAYGASKPFDSYGAPVNPMDSYGALIKPIDSYGDPIKTTDEPTSPNYPETSSRFENHDYGFDNEYKIWKNYQRDQKIEYSKKKPTTLLDPKIFVTPLPVDDEEYNLNSYSDIYMHREKIKEKKHKPKYNKSKKPQYFPENLKLMNRPYKMLKTRQEPDDDVIVGGQYAEPPARYVPKFQPSAPMSDDDNDFSPQQSFKDSDGVISAYVNYKNSNLAFSPQNLNDAFSIVDK